MTYENYNEDEDYKKLSFRNWKVYIDNSSVWFDEINKRIVQCYADTSLIKLIYPQIRTFASSRRANLDNFEIISKQLDIIRDIIYSEKYNEMRKVKSSGDWDIKILTRIDEIIRLLSIGLSEGELTPKINKVKEIPYEKVGNVNDLINKALTKNNNTSINKDGTITSN
jgi:hypothetical protein